MLFDVTNLLCCDLINYYAPVFVCVCFHLKPANKLMYAEKQMNKICKNFASKYKLHNLTLITRKNVTGKFIRLQIQAAFQQLPSSAKNLSTISFIRWHHNTQYSTLIVHIKILKTLSTFPEFSMDILFILMNPKQMTGRLCSRFHQLNLNFLA